MVSQIKLLSKINIIKSKIEEEYYQDVLNFCNYMFISENDYLALSLLSLRITCICFDAYTFEAYNYIVKKYGLDVDMVNTQLLLNNSLKDNNTKIQLSIIMANNLLKKIDYKIFQTNKKNKLCLYIKKI